ncbi:chemotaxis protein CheD [Candidatus Formimonas warabiya]|uniref:Probable chemoreceptor glutamine deamidase CheD n=1 Tax=Formimonas warabiya TaxID=1761012 RepID=A0A3G1KPD3_FORW1|nr:chemotaxis protein CheD [Candidatus Formimonas warabiya]ATW24307.1 chemotaxis protein CheD [Candidatus Formimonas warabiya]
MSNPIIVGISDLNVTLSPGVLVSYALGSCVGICLYDSTTRIAGLSHIMLPSITGFKKDANIMKFADTATVELVRRMENLGAKRSRMVAKIAGGAQMFSQQGISDAAQIGNRNISATKEVLRSLNIKLVAEDTGLNYGRTVEFFAETGLLRVKSISYGTKEI